MAATFLSGQAGDGTATEIYHVLQPWQKSITSILCKQHESMAPCFFVSIAQWRNDVGPLTGHHLNPTTNPSIAADHAHIFMSSVTIF